MGMKEAAAADVILHTRRDPGKGGDCHLFSIHFDA